jgi:CheY-like chemotaxis protein
VGNAIKFTEKGEVKISVEQINETGELVELKFSVADTGIGIPEHKLGSVFEGFTQATNDTTRKYGGTGLGLTIVKQLVELQGGSIAVESKLGEGSVFSFQLQFKKGHGRSGLDRKSRQEEEENEMPKLKGLNLLLVEDNFLNQVLAKKVLNDWNWEVDVAENGLVAIEKHTAKNFDLILMDIQLPEMDGYEATKHIRRKMAPDKSGIPIIAMTAHAISGEADKCFKAGMNDYISKPFDPKDLYSKIANIINRKKGLQTQPHTSLQSSNVTKTMSNPKCIDLTYLKELSNGSQDFIQQMIKLFLEQTPQGIETMEAAYGSKDWKMLKAAAHKMKPSFGFMGISGLKDIVAELEEDAAKGANEAGMGEKIAKIKSVCSQAFAELEAERT